MSLEQGYLPIDANIAKSFVSYSYLGMGCIMCTMFMQVQLVLVGSHLEFS